MYYRLHYALLRKRSNKGEEIMSYDIATWIAAFFLIVPALMYAAVVVHDIKKREQKEKKS